MKVNDRVKILRTDIRDLDHRTNRYGIVTAIDGEYVMVRPMWCRWVIELYPNEIKAI